MSATAVPLQPIKKGSLTKFWIAIALLIGAAFLLSRLAGPDGLEIKTVAEGTGVEIGELDGVMINYTGRTKDGTVFDSTEGRGPAPFLVSQTIPGFTQALLKMREGGKYEVHIPARLAYGDPAPGGAPSGPLDFEVEVVKVVKDAALQVAAMQAAQARGQGQPQAAPEGQ